MDGVTETVSKKEDDDKEDKEVNKSKLVMVLAASNIPWDLDPAIRRRLEKRVYIPLPTAKGRKKIFEICLKSIKCDENIDWDKLVKLTDMYSGADISNVCREAAYMPMKRKLFSGGGLMQSKLKDVNKLQEELDVPIVMDDFIKALKNVQKSVGTEHLKKYSKWMEEFGSK